MRTENKLLPLNEVTGLINNKRVLLIAANEDLLQKLPVGNWIGGTIPYFMNVDGGCMNKDMLFVTDVTDYSVEFKIKEYTPTNLQDITIDRFNDGFSYIIIPGFSNIHQSFAVDVYSIQGIYDVPLAGWITGIDLAEIGKQTPKVVNGQTKNFSSNLAVLLHIRLPKNKYAKLEILNLFQQGEGDVITFTSEGFECTNCLVNGKEQNLAEYLIKNNIDTKLPLVANYSGAMINISFQNVDKDLKKVSLYAPVRKNIEYKIAQPVTNYVKEFHDLIPSDTSTVVFSCNCILNYLYSELEGKKTEGLTGPFTFGEIAYVLVNQTMVYLSIEE